MWLIYINDNDESYAGFTKLKNDIVLLKNIGETLYFIFIYQKNLKE